MSKAVPTEADFKAVDAMHHSGMSYARIEECLQNTTKRGLLAAAKERRELAERQTVATHQPAGCIHDELLNAKPMSPAQELGLDTLFLSL